MPMPKKLIVTASQKGGSGKTVLARALLDHLRTADVTVAAYDGDGAVGGLYKHFGSRDSARRLESVQDPCRGVVVYDIRNADTRDTLFESLAADSSLVLHDLAGGALLPLLELFQDDAEGALVNFNTALEDLDSEMIVLHLVTRDDGSVASLAQYLDLTAGCSRIRHVAVINRHNGRDTDLSTWFGVPGGRTGGRTRTRLLEQGGLEMELPPLEPTAMKLIEDRGLTFNCAVDDPTLPLIQRQRIRQFLRAVDAALTLEIREALGIEA